MVNAPKLFQRYFDVEGLPQALLIQPEENEEVEKKKAEENVMRILKKSSKKILLTFLSDLRSDASGSMMPELQLMNE
jgi:hypothetical protein